MAIPIPPEVQAYVDDIAPEHRPMWERVEGTIRALHPDVQVRITYRMPTFVVGTRELPVGVWSHGVSLYGVDESNDGGFIARHPDLSTGRGTVKLPTRRAAEITDAELATMLRALLPSS